MNNTTDVFVLEAEQNVADNELLAAAAKIVNDAVRRVLQSDDFTNYQKRDFLVVISRQQSEWLHGFCDRELAQCRRELEQELADE